MAKPNEKQRWHKRVNQVVYLRILPEDNMSRPIQDCKKLMARITTAVCAARSNRANANGGSALDNPYYVCKGCPIGKRNASIEENRTPVVTSQAKEGA